MPENILPATVNTTFFLLCSLKDVEPTLHFINSNNESQTIQWLGISSKNLGQLKQAESKEVEMRLFPAKAGLFSIPLVKVTDCISKENYDYKELASVKVL